ncbi:MAG: hypothetical protein Q7W30_10725 [Coriobacteriia bacterium]|nr:hypothetical protein [Coriobacteriia bacterium]
MDYTGIIKRAWYVTWNYKILWLFGFFAGAGGGAGNLNTGGGNNFSNTGSGSQQTAQMQQFFERYLVLIIVVAVVLMIIGFAMWILSIAARGGIIHMVNEIEERRPVTASDGWRVGFAKWGRVFWLYFLAGLPIFLVVMIFLVMVLVLLGGTAATGAFQSDASPAALFSLIGGGCFFYVILLVVLFVLSVLIALVGSLGVQYAVLRDMTAMDSLKQAWADVRAKRGAFMMYLYLFGVGIVYGIAIAIVLGIIMVPGIVAIIAGQVGIGAFFIMMGVLISIIPSSAYGAFVNAAWTIFFRRMTGMEPAPGMAAPGGPSPYGTGYPPPAPGAFPPPPVADAFPPPPPAAPRPPSSADQPLGAAYAPWLAPPEDLPADAPPAPPAGPTASDPWAAAHDLPGEPPADA